MTRSSLSILIFGKWQLEVVVNVIVLIRLVWIISRAFDASIARGATNKEINVKIGLNKEYSESYAIPFLILGKHLIQI